MMSLTDEQLVASLAQGETTALDALYERYANRLFVFCDRTLGGKDPQESEDIVQDVFIRVIKAAHRFDPTKASFRTWLYRIARNRCIDIQRKKGRYRFLRLDQQLGSKEPDGGPPLEEILPDSNEGIESKMDEAALHKAIRDCIQALDDTEERQAILLYYLTGKVYREIADILGKSLSTAKNRIDTAQAKVKDCLAVKGFS